MQPPDTTDGSSSTFSRRIPLIVAAAFFMETLDSTIVVTSLPAIAQSLGESTLDLTASITIYLVAMAVFVPTAGWASERYGARNVFAAAIGVFTLASLLCALSQTFWALIGARLLQGTAAAFMSPVGRLVVLRETPKDRIIDAIGLIVWPGLLGPVIGPPLGGFITTYASWQWIFLINIPLGLLGVYLVLRYVPRHAEGTRTRFDATGFVLTAVALAALIQGLSLVAERGGAMLAGGVFVAVGLGCGFAAVRHALRHPAPLLALAATRIPTFALSTVTAGMIARIAISMTPFLLPLMFQIGFGASPFEAGIMLLVYMSGNLAMKSVTTPILHRWSFRNVIRVNGTLCVAALVGCGFLSPLVPAPVIYGVLFLAGMTRSMHFTSVSTLAFADMPPTLTPGATTLAAMAQQVAGALGVAVAALALGLFQSFRNGAQLSLSDFQNAHLAAAGLMAIAVVWALRLPRDAGAELSRRK
ncbi:MAG: MFS transporter [Betaproteobacteria bacterium]|nr:MFS transporter [Betaproteobacteria bacterium]